MRSLLLDVFLLGPAAMLFISATLNGQASATPPSTQAAVMTQPSATADGDLSGEHADALRKLFVRRQPETRGAGPGFGGSLPGPSTVYGFDPDVPTSQPGADLSASQAEILRKLMDRRVRELRMGNPNPDPQLPLPGIPIPQ